MRHDPPLTSSGPVDWGLGEGLLPLGFKSLPRPRRDARSRTGQNQVCGCGGRTHSADALNNNSSGRSLIDFGARETIGRPAATRAATGRPSACGRLAAQSSSTGVRAVTVGPCICREWIAEAESGELGGLRRLMSSGRSGSQIASGPMGPSSARASAGSTTQVCTVRCLAGLTPCATPMQWGASGPLISTRCAGR